MKPNEILQLLRQNFPFEPTSDQEYALEVLSKFLPSQSINPLLVLKGFAGTGKTTLVTSLVKTLPKLDIGYVLLAPTGRSSKVLTKYSKKYALTIHKKIYSVEDSGGGLGKFVLDINRHKNTLFIVDEASMISGETEFFTGSSLLDDIIRYTYNNKGCRILFIGDTAQLPPIGSDLSPALNLNYLKSSYPISAAALELKEVMRQEQYSGILYNSTVLRKTLQNDGNFIRIYTDDYEDIVPIDGYSLEEELESAYSKYGYEETIVITRSNKRANQFNQQIRTRIKWQEDEISTGDLMMVVKNNYFWLPKESKAGFIANGDTIEILSFSSPIDKYGFRFANATIRLVDYPNEPEYDVKLLLDTINSESPSLTNDENKKLYYAVLEDYMHISNKKERLLKLKNDPYFNALQVKFAYAVTCHKAQGGQWKAVFVDQGYLPQEGVTTEYLRWLYTAFTRASEKLYLIGFHDDFFT